MFSFQWAILNYILVLLMAWKEKLMETQSGNTGRDTNIIHRAFTTEYSFFRLTSTSAARGQAPDEMDAPPALQTISARRRAQWRRQREREKTLGEENAAAHPPMWARATPDPSENGDAREEEWPVHRIARTHYEEGDREAIDNLEPRLQRIFQNQICRQLAMERLLRDQEAQIYVLEFVVARYERHQIGSPPLTLEEQSQPGSPPCFSDDAASIPSASYFSNSSV